MSDQVTGHPNWSPEALVQQSYSKHVSLACTGGQPCSRFTAAALLTACLPVLQRVAGWTGAANPPAWHPAALTACTARACRMAGPL